MTEDQWLRPSIMRERYVDHVFSSVEQADKQLYLAVINGDVRARLNGRVLGPEWLKQVSKLETDGTNPFALPPDLELSVEDAERVWTGR